MPLKKGAKPGSKDFGKNIAVEIEYGKPKKQAIAIAYSEAKRASDNIEKHKKNRG